MHTHHPLGTSGCCRDSMGLSRESYIALVKMLSYERFHRAPIGELKDYLLRTNNHHPASWTANLSAILCVVNRQLTNMYGSLQCIRYSEAYVTILPILSPSRFELSNPIGELLYPVSKYLTSCQGRQNARSYHGIHTALLGPKSTIVNSGGEFHALPRRRACFADRNRRIHGT